MYLIYIKLLILKVLFVLGLSNFIPSNPPTNIKVFIPQQILPLPPHHKLKRWCISCVYMINDAYMFTYAKDQTYIK